MIKDMKVVNMYAFSFSLTFFFHIINFIYTCKFYKLLQNIESNWINILHWFK